MAKRLRKAGYGEQSFFPGPLVRAMKEGSILFINELNRMPESVQNVLLPALDEEQALPGLLAGQYQAPNFTYQFADAPPGFPNIPNNFQDIPFLFSGEGATLPLKPFPPFQP